MSQKNRRMSGNFIAGLDIGTSRTCAVIGELVGEGGRQPGLKILGVGQTRSGGIRGERITNLEETTESILSAMKEAELMAGVQVDRLYAGISGQDIRAWSSMGVVAVQDQEITPGDVARVHEVARAVALPPDAEMLHAIPVEYVVDHQRGSRTRWACRGPGWRPTSTWWPARLPPPETSARR